jgi:hypothetical protein
MDPVTDVSAQDLIEVAIPDQGSASGYKTGKESLAQVGNFIANGISYAGLPTTDQTLVGAITELDGDRATLSESITDAYDNTATYDVGDLCIYNNTLYKCNTAIATPEDFDSTKWTQTTVMAEAGNVTETKVNFGTTSYVNVTDAFYIEYQNYFYVCVNVTAAQNIPASTAILTDGPAVANAQNVPITKAGNGVFSVEPAVFGSSKNFILRNSANNGDLIAFTGTIAK